MPAVIGVLVVPLPVGDQVEVVKVARLDALCRICRVKGVYVWREGGWWGRRGSWHPADSPSEMRPWWACRRWGLHLRRGSAPERVTLSPSHSSERMPSHGRR